MLPALAVCYGLCKPFPPSGPHAVRNYGVKYKAAQFTVEGSIVAVCRRCAEQNHAESHHQHPTPVETRA